MSTKGLGAYVTEVAHKHGVKISKEAKLMYKNLPDKAAVDDMVGHAAKLVKALDRKVIPEKMAKIEMAHYSKK